MYPALAVVEPLNRHGVTASDILWVGTHGQMEEDLVPRAGLRLETVAGGPIAGVPRLTQLKNGAKLIGSIGSAWRIFGRFRPNVLLLTGGYVNLPVAIAAKLRGVPSAVYLPDVEPGAAIRRIEPLVEKIACTTEGSKQFLPESKLVVTGYPVRKELRAALNISQAEARQALGLDPERFTLFVFGGSRGAQSINRALMAILPDLLTDAQVVHVSGTLTWPEVETFAATLPEALRERYKPFPYLHEQMATAFRSADLVVARAGASMLGECPAFGVPSILVPYPHAWRYQKVNADFLADQGAGIRMNDEDMHAKLLPTIRTLISDSAQLERMRLAVKKLDIEDAANNIAEVLIKLSR